MNSCRRTGARLLLSLTLGLALVAPGGAAPAFPYTVRDALGRTVTIPRPGRRIVSVAPSVTEILFALGAGGRVVGVSDADDYPPEGVRGKTRVGGVVLNVERILTLHPDLVLGVASLQRSELERMIALGLPVLAVEARSLDETLAQVALIGRVTDRSAAAAALAGRLRARVAAVEGTVRGRARPRVYVEIWDQPLQTAAGGTFVDDLLGRAGGRNLFADLQGWPQVAPEAVIRRDPDVILLTYRGRGRLVGRAGWSGVAAVRRGHIYELHPDLVSRPGPRLVDGLERIARLLHREVFPPP